MPFLRQSYKQKPKQWGPVSAVQSALFHNLERMGIDPQTCQLALPMWERTGGIAHNYAKNNDGVITSPEWIENGLKYASVVFPSVFISGAFTIIWNRNVKSISADNPFVGNSNGSRWVSIDGDYPEFRAAELGANCGINAGVSSIGHINECYIGKRYGGGAVLMYYANGVYLGIGGTTWDGFGTYFDRLANGAADVVVDQMSTFDGNLNGTQIALLSDNPYQLWQPVPQKTIFLPQGGSVETFLSMSGLINAISRITGQAHKGSELYGSVSSVSSIISDLSVLRGVSGSTQAESSISGQVSNAKSLKGYVNAKAKPAGQMSILKTLSGQISGQSNITGALSISRGLSGYVGAVGDIQGQILHRALLTVPL